MCIRSKHLTGLLLVPGVLALAVAVAAADQRLVDAAAAGDSALVRALLAEGVDVNTAPRTGTTPRRSICCCAPAPR